VTLSEVVGTEGFVKAAGFGAEMTAGVLIDSAAGLFSSRPNIRRAALKSLLPSDAFFVGSFSLSVGTWEITLSGF
jgi:hypothetical protein